MSTPLIERKQRLGELLKTPQPSVLPVTHIEEEGQLLYAQALALELEGIVAKDLASPCLPGVRSSDWLKIKRLGAVPAERSKYGKSSAG